VRRVTLVLKEILVHKATLEVREKPVRRETLVHRETLVLRVILV
jgi:hypothetical protein